MTVKTFALCFYMYIMLLRMVRLATVVYLANLAGTVEPPRTLYVKKNLIIRDSKLTFTPKTLNSYMNDR